MRHRPGITHMIYKAPNHCSGWILSGLFYKWGNLEANRGKILPKGTQWASGRTSIWNSYPIWLQTSFFLPCHELFIGISSKKKIPRVELWNQEIMTTSVALITTSMKIHREKETRKIMCKPMSAFLKISCSFWSVRNFVRLHFLYLRKWYAGKFNYWLIFHTTRFILILYKILENDLKI